MLKSGGLPKLPLPPLEQTMEKYLIAMQPLTTPQQLDRLKNLVKSFSSSTAIGPRLQLYLEEQREQKDNWVSCIIILIAHTHTYNSHS